MKRRERRLERVRQAKAELEAEAAESRAAALREQAEGMEDTAESHEDEVMRRRLRTSATKLEPKPMSWTRRDDETAPGVRW